jgi:hypothetical protein
MCEPLPTFKRPSNIHPPFQYPSKNAHLHTRNSTTANIAKSSVPTNVQGDLLASKMVDFVLVLRPPEHSPLESHIRHLVDNPLNKHDLITINQSEYTPLQNSPIAVSMETKAQRANVEEGSIQLGIWTAAWHKRMDMLGVASGDIITLPLLHVENADWKLYFAIDTGVAGIVSAVTRTLLPEINVSVNVGYRRPVACR